MFPLSIEKKRLEDLPHEINIESGGKDLISDCEVQMKSWVYRKMVELARKANGLRMLVVRTYRQALSVNIWSLHGVQTYVISDIFLVTFKCLW